MAGMRICNRAEFSEPRRSNLVGNPVHLALDSIGFSYWTSPITVGYAADRKSTVWAGIAYLGFSMDGGKRGKSYPRAKWKNRADCSSDGGDGEPALRLADQSQMRSSDGGALPDLGLAQEEIVDLGKHDRKHFVYRKNGRKLWKRLWSVKKSARDPRHTLEEEAQGCNAVMNDIGEDASLSTISPESSVEECNSVLACLEKHSGERALDFFEWMKDNGKLKKNTDAYHLALQAIAWKEDSKRAELLLHEMVADSECTLDARAFNGLIYVCAKRRLVDCGTRWFTMMLERKVQPDASTIGMLMGLYQKTGNLSEAEYAFAKMRNYKVKCVKAYSAMITIYTRLGLYAKSEEVIFLMEEDGVVPNLENWLVQLNAYSQQGKLEEAELVLKCMTEAGVSPNIVAYNTLITGYGKKADVRSAEKIFFSLESAGLAPDEITYRSMVEGFGKADKYKEATLYYKKLKASGFEPNSSNFYTMLNLLARHEDNEGTVEVLQDMRAAGCQFSAIVSILVRAYGRAGRIRQVLPILDACFYEEILLDATSCSILVTTFIKNSLLEPALRVLRDKKWKDSAFEENLCHTLICICKEAGHFDDAVKIYDQMPKSEMLANLHIACSMIEVFSSLERFADAEDLYRELKASVCGLDMIAYSIVVRMFIKAGRLEDACLVLEDMEKQKEIIPDKYLFFDMLRTYQKCDLLEKLADTYYWIVRSGVERDEAMYNCVINCCGRAIPVDELSRIFDEMIQSRHLPNTITFNVMLDIYGKAGLFKKARKVFLMARKQGLADIISYNTMIAAYAQSGDFDSMNYFVQRMQDAGFPVSLEAYNCMLDAYGKEGQLEEFNAVLQKMKKARCEFDHYTYNVMINVYGKQGWIEDVAHVLAELKSRGVEPDLYSYNTLIKAYGIARMPEEAVNVMKEMRIKGISPDRVTYTNLITAMKRNENFLEAVKWSLWMKQTGCGS